MGFEWRSCVVVTLGFLLALSVVIPCTNGPLEGQSVAPHIHQPETTNIATIGTSSRSHRDHAASMQGIADAAEAVRFLPPTINFREINGPCSCSCPPLSPMQFCLTYTRAMACTCNPGQPPVTMTKGKIPIGGNAPSKSSQSASTMTTAVQTTATVPAPGVDSGVHPSRPPTPVAPTHQPMSPTTPPPPTAVDADAKLILIPQPPPAPPITERSGIKAAVVFLVRPKGA